MEEGGYLRHGAGRPRTAVEPGELAARPGSGDGVEVPLVGRIAAGVPLMAEQMVEDTFWLPRKMVGEGTLFMLRVAGDSMTGAGIADGDLVVIREQPVAENGEIVAAAVTSGSEAEATVKTLQQANGHLWLMPQNPSYAPIPADEATIFGKVVAVLRCRALPAQQVEPRGPESGALTPPRPWRERASTAGGWPAAWSRIAGAPGIGRGSITTLRTPPRRQRPIRLDRRVMATSDIQTVGMPAWASESSHPNPFPSSMRLKRALRPPRPSSGRILHQKGWLWRRAWSDGRRPEARNAIPTPP